MERGGAHPTDGATVSATPPGLHDRAGRPGRARRARRRPHGWTSSGSAALATEAGSGSERRPSPAARCSGSLCSPASTADRAGPARRSRRRPTPLPVCPRASSTPSPWLPGTDEVGPPGQVIAMGAPPVARGRARRTAWSTVSAATGDYRLPRPARLDRGLGRGAGALPGRPAGRLLGCGPGRQAAPNTAEGGGAPLSRVAVYDTVDGTLARHTFDERARPHHRHLAWVDASTLVAEPLPARRR